MDNCQPNCESPAKVEVPVNPISDEMEKEICIRFSYHSPSPTQPPRYELLRTKARLLARDIIRNCPESRERSIALTKLDEVVMFANAAIARRD